MTETQEQTQQEKTLIVEQLSRLTNRSTSMCYGLAGRLRKTYGTELAVETLSQMWPGRPLAYYLGAVRRAQQKTAAWQMPDVMKEIFE
jgi:hypothetical protein